MDSAHPVHPLAAFCAPSRLLLLEAEKHLLLRRPPRFFAQLSHLCLCPPFDRGGTGAVHAGRHGSGARLHCACALPSLGNEKVLSPILVLDGCEICFCRFCLPPGSCSHTYLRSAH